MILLRSIPVQPKRSLSSCTAFVVHALLSLFFISSIFGVFNFLTISWSFLVLVACPSSYLTSQTPFFLHISSRFPFAMKSMLMHIHSRLHRPPHFYLVILGGSLFAAHVFCVAREWGLLDAEWGVWRAFVAFGDVGGVRVVSWVLCMGVAAVFCACYDKVSVVLAVVWACRWVWQRVAVPAVVGVLRGGRAA